MSLASLLALLVLSTGAHAMLKVDIVVSLCRESTTRHVNMVQHVLDSTGQANLVLSTVHLYCKCGERDHACVQLPNVGREGHTFVHHILERWSSLADVTIFLNGGTGTDGRRLKLATDVAARVGSHGKELLFADHQQTFLQPLSLVSNETTEHFLQRAAGWQCGHEGEKLDVTCCEGLCNMFCCHLVVPSSCPESYLTFQNQTDCQWRGDTPENYEGTNYEARMAAADPPNFALWLSQHWGLEYDVWDAVKWADKAIFAASRQALRRVPRASWERQLEALGRHTNGGVEGLYLERSWRAILTK